MENMENMDAMEKRHERELKELSEKIKLMLKGSKKGSKAQIEAEAIQMQFDLKAKHREEMDELEEKGFFAPPEGTIVVQEESEVKAEEVDQVAEEERIAAQKKAKSKKKQDKRQAKLKEKEDVKIQISASAGESARETETNALQKQLEKEHLKIKEIPSDGHCLYRAIADQLLLVEQNHSKEANDMSNLPDFRQLRIMASDFIRRRSEDFAPFIGCSPDDEAFNQYCEKVASEALAEWGGELEVRALSECLGYPIYIYSASSPLLKMGDDSRGLTPIRLSYHRHFYALGEHYNSIIPAGCC